MQVEVHSSQYFRVSDRQEVAQIAAGLLSLMPGQLFPCQEHKAETPNLHVKGWTLATALFSFRCLQNLSTVGFWGI